MWHLKVSELFSELPINFSLKNASSTLSEFNCCGILKSVHLLNCISCCGVRKNVLSDILGFMCCVFQRMRHQTYLDSLVVMTQRMQLQISDVIWITCGMFSQIQSCRVDAHFARRSKSATIIIIIIIII